MNKLLLAVLVSLLLTRVVMYAVNEGSVYWDEAVFLHLQQSIQTSGYVSDLGEQYRPPFVPYAFSLFDSTRALYVFITVIVVLTVLAYTRLWREPRESLLGGILLASSPMYLFWNSKLLTESFAVLEVVLVILAVERWLSSEKETWLYGAAFVSGVAAMTRYPLLVVGGTVLLFILIRGGPGALKQRQVYLASLFFLLGLTPLFYLGIENYGNPLAMPLVNSEITAVANEGPWFYLSAFLPTFTVVGALALLGAWFYAWRGEGGVLGQFLALLFAIYVLLMSTIVGQKYDRFLIPMLPVVAWFAVLALSRLGARVGRVWSNVVACGVTLAVVGLFVRGVDSVRVAAPSARPLVEATEFVASLRGDWIFCNPVPHCRFFGQKLPVYLPATYEELISVANERDIGYAVLDSFDPAPSYGDILAGQPVVFEASTENRRVLVVSLQGLR